MSRNPVHVRDATPEDAAALLEIWADFSKRTYSEGLTGEPRLLDAASAVVRIAADPDQRLIVGLLAGDAIAALHLVRLRAKLPVEPPAAARMRGRSHRPVAQVLAHRRSLRRARDQSG